MKRTLGIVGLGRFGRLAAAQLKDRFELVVYDREDCKEAADRLGVRTAPLGDVAGCSVVLLCVPISGIEQVLREITPYLVEGSLVVDTCSVKEYPVSAMKAILPDFVEILGTHPLFGPDSAAGGLEGRKIVICPVRLQDPRRVERFLRRLKLRVLVSSPEAHDLAMASTQAIVQFLGRAFLEMGLSRHPMATPGYDQLIGILEVVQHDTWELFFDMQNFNRFVPHVRERLVGSLTALNRRLSSRSPALFERNLEGRKG
ncbi:MAG: prephenate dehydrogenase [Deltaproteobacteria bacterium]|nr:prephenate dehydrogenase [Deltaproteobacteria bacterium]MBW2121764.1 prephenate dehydrogenase [Deltaproteobacteria bacterium]